MDTMMGWGGVFRAQPGVSDAGMASSVPCDSLADKIGPHPGFSRRQ